MPLSTAPDAPATVWAQCRFLLHKPLSVGARDKLQAECQLRCNKERESYSFQMKVLNKTTRMEADCGPIELSNVYARHFAKAKVDGMRSY
eukprot:symbB.v1.2.025048.t1/scaffold2411.1/size79909/2